MRYATWVNKFKPKPHPLGTDSGMDGYLVDDYYDRKIDTFLFGKITKRFPGKGPLGTDLVEREPGACGPKYKYLWTVLESDTGRSDAWYITPGFHLVNRVGYVITEVPWPTDVELLIKY